MSVPKVEIFKDKAGEWRWHVKAANGEIVAQGEGHTSEEDAQRACHEAFVNFREAEAREGGSG